MRLSKVSVSQKTRRLKTTVFVSLLFMSIITQGIAQSDKKEIFVSPQGSDTYSGTEAKPFRTLEQARDAARSINREKKVIISLRGGIYERDKVFELTTEDSGNERNPIVYRGYPGEDVRIIGGKAVSDWEKVSDKAVLELLPSEARDQVVRADLKSLDINNYGQVKDDGLELFFQEKPMMFPI
jgi:hypothetical protein